MLLTITTTHRPATDLGYLLAKHPARVQTFPLSWGHAHVFYPEAGEDRCTAALALDLDPVGLVRGGRPPGTPGTLAEYVNDRPYVASSFLSVAIAEVLGSALGGRCPARPELVETALPLEARVAALPVRAGEDLVRRLFEPLGYFVEVDRIALDERFPDWGPSRYVTLGLRGTVRLKDLLTHLYVLVPVLDLEKHYWVGPAEIEKLLLRGEGWLAAHPERETIARRYLARRPSLARLALARLADEDPDPLAGDEDETPSAAAGEAALEDRISLADERVGVTLAVLRAAGAHSVVDLGCGEGRLLRALLDDPAFERIRGVDVSATALERAAARLRLDEMAPARRARIELQQGSLVYRDRRLEGFDAACLLEVVEHLDEWRLPALERVLFGHARPRVVVVTTPNREHNVLFEGLRPGAFRHADHRFEWTRAEFAAWAQRIAAAHGGRVRFLPVGTPHPSHGPPTQMAVVER